MTDLTAWQQAFARLKESDNKTAKAIERASHAELDPPEQAKAALAVLEELKIYGPVLAELRAASQHPRVRYPVEYKVDDPFAILLPHLAKIKGLLQELRLQSSAELAAGQTSQAFTDVRVMLWLCDSLESESFLISQLVRIAGQQITTQPIWEGLARHQWSEAQLKELQERFLRVNFAGSMSHSMDGERAGGVAVMQSTIRRNNLGEMLGNLTAESETPVASKTTRQIAGWITPRGWLYFEMVNHSILMDGLVANGWDAETGVFHPLALDENEKRLQSQMSGGFSAVWHHHVLARLLIPALTKASRRFSRAQATANQAALACALERYHLSHGAYPESLAQLVPQYLAKIPNQAISTEVMRYVRTGDRFILYSVGWDGVDDNGAFAVAKEGEPEKGDWVWRSAP